VGAELYAIQKAGFQLERAQPQCHRWAAVADSWASCRTQQFNRTSWPVIVASTSLSTTRAFSAPGAPEAMSSSSPDQSSPQAARGAAQHAPLRRRRNVGAVQRLTAFHALPDSLRDNEYITKYYRVNYNAKQTIRSLFGLHNETGNIWTHFIGMGRLQLQKLSIWLVVGCDSAGDEH
jgi:hypothetical protein